MRHPFLEFVSSSNDKTVDQQFQCTKKGVGRYISWNFFFRKYVLHNNCTAISPLWDISKKSWPIWLYWDKVMKLTKCHQKTPLCYVMIWRVRWVTLALEGGPYLMFICYDYFVRFQRYKTVLFISSFSSKSGIKSQIFAKFSMSSSIIR